MSLNALLNKIAATLAHLETQLDAVAGLERSEHVLTDLTSSFALLNTNLREASDLAKRELDPDRREQWSQRIRSLRGDLDRFKDRVEDARRGAGQAAKQRLLGNTTSSTLLFNPNNPPSEYFRQESSMLDTIGTRLDELIAAGSNIVGSLAGQRSVLKGTRRYVLDGVQGLRSGSSTMASILRRHRVSGMIFWGGVTLVVLAIYFLIFRGSK